MSLCEGTFLWLPTPSVDDHEWLKISIAARQARHSRPLTTLRYYCATWPIQLFFELSQTLESVPVDDGYATYVDGLRSDALRQALSRVRRSNPESPLAEWQMLANRLSKISSIPSLAKRFSRRKRQHLGLCPENQRQKRLWRNSAFTMSASGCRLSN